VARAVSNLGPKADRFQISILTLLQKGFTVHPSHDGASHSRERKRGRFILIVSVALSLESVF